MTEKKQEDTNTTAKSETVVDGPDKKDPVTKTATVVTAAAPAVKTASTAKAKNTADTTGGNGASAKVEAEAETAADPKEAKKTGIRAEALADLDEIRKLVMEAIASGAKNVEQVHLAIANLPLKYLEKIEMIESAVNGVKQVQEKTIGQVYSLIQNITTKADGFAQDILKRAEGR
jgi:hypothetical protein